MSESSEVTKTRPPYERPPIKTTEALLDLIKEVQAQGKRIVVINDFDSTVDQYGPSGGVMPFDTVLHPAAGIELAGMERKGVIIGAISNRSGEAIDDRYAQRDIMSPFTVTTYGYEVRRRDKLDAQDKSYIDKEFEPYSVDIGQILEGVRMTVMEKIGLPTLPTNFAEVTIPTTWGPIYLERKGRNPDYPEGLAQRYNFNKMVPKDREEFSRIMIKAFNDSMDDLSSKYSPAEFKEFKKKWGIKIDDEPELNRYSIEFKPLSAQAKGKGIVKLFRSIRESGIYGYSPVGLIIYAGDADADASAMQANRLLERFDRGDVRAVGIWVNPGNDHKKVKEGADIHVNGVEEYVKLLQQINEVVVPFEDQDKI